MHYKTFSHEDIASLQAACAVLSRNKVCYCIEVHDDGRTYTLSWKAYNTAVRGRRAGS